MGPLYLIGMWFGEDQIENISNTHVLKKIGLRFQILIPALHSIVNTIGRTYVSCWEINKHALPLIMIKSGDIWFLIWSLHVFYCGFANATRVPTFFPLGLPRQRDISMQQQFYKKHKKKKKKKTLHILTRSAMRGCELTSLEVCINDKTVIERKEMWQWGVRLERQTFVPLGFKILESERHYRGWYYGVWV